MDKLKPCPYCGENELGIKTHSHPIIEHSRDTYITDSFFIHCFSCGALGPPCSTWDEAEKAWNERANNKEGE